MDLPGTRIIELVATASTECVLVAPFIQRGAFHKVIEAVPSNVHLIVLTRWRATDILSGVSDPSIWPLIKARPNSSLFLRADLHAKFYRADQSCLIGSANITGAALGWSSTPNSELLWPISPQHPELISIEREWLKGAIRVNDELYEWASSLTPEVPETARPELDPDPAVGSGFWWPRLRHPEDLWVAYTSGSLPPSTLEAARIDLSALAIPPGLSREQFEAAIKASLLQKVERAWVDERLIDNQRFGAIKNSVANLFESHGIERSPAEAWQTMIRWLIYFLPDHYRYKQPRHSEILELKKSRNE